MTPQSWLLTLLLTATAHALEERKDPLSNLRPTNITGLPYYLYRWTGIYYNGTTTIRIEPQEFIDDSECDTWATEPIEIVYEDSMLGILEESGYADEPNPLAFRWQYWDRNVNITPPSNSVHSNGPINDMVRIDSIDLNSNDKPIVTPTPHWKLNSTHISGSSYGFEGYRNNSIQSQAIKFNYSQCHTASLAEYQGIILEYDEDYENGSSTDLIVSGPPLVTARFDNQSASISIRGVFIGSAASEGSEEMNYLGGPITVSFLGSVDTIRSDGLLPNPVNGTPLWNETMGYVFDVNGKEIRSGALGREHIGGWLVMLSVLAVSICCL